ncbi:MAG: diguanylate cyclase [Rhizobacter sp.]|nr:diguanylate cyclase [Rhizobacter sp.]
MADTGFTVMALGGALLAVQVALVLWFARRSQRASLAPAGVAQPAGAVALRLRDRSHHRVRLGMYTLLLAAGALTAFQVWQADRSERQRAFDNTVLDLAGAQRMLSQRIGLLAGTLGQRPLDSEPARLALSLALERAQRDGRRLEGLLREQNARLPTDAESLWMAVGAWQAAGARLWASAGDLLAALDHADAPALTLSVAAVQAEVDPALQAAQRLVDEVGAVAGRRHLAMVGDAKTWAALSLALLTLFAVSAAEPTARSVRRQYLKLAAQAAELQRLALVAERTNNAVILTDAQHRIVWVNAAFTRITGHPAGDALGQLTSALLRSERTDPKSVTRARAQLDQGQAVRGQFLNQHRDGHDLWLDIDVQPLRDASGTLTGFVHVATDITDRRQAQADLRVAAIAFETLEAIAVTDPNQVILKVNAAFTRITGYTAEEAVGQVTGKLLKSGRQDAAFYAAMWDVLLREKHWQGEVWNRRKSGEVYAEWLSITAVTDDDGDVLNYVAVFTDITQRKQAEETIHRLAFYDPLTELPNRRLLRDRVHQARLAAARHQGWAAVMFIDLDRFKELNDTRGHDVGDLLLVEVARRLKSQVRAHDTVARLGGDEFVVVLEALGPAHEAAAAFAAGVAEKLREAIGRPYRLRGHDCHTSPSVGVCLFQGDALSVDELLRRADVAMYAAKKAGRDVVRFFDAQGAAAGSQDLAQSGS